MQTLRHTNTYTYVYTVKALLTDISLWRQSFSNVFPNFLNIAGICPNLLYKSPWGEEIIEIQKCGLGFFGPRFT